MKRMSPDRRTGLVSTLIQKLEHEWLCHHGAWNKDKLFHDLEKKLRERRRNGKA